MKHFKFLAMLLTAIAFTACSNDKDEFNAQADDTIHFVANIKAPRTKAGVDAAELQDEAFKSGAEMNLYITKSTSKWEDVENYTGSSETPNAANESWATPFKFRCRNLGDLWSPESKTFKWPASGGIDVIGIYPNTVTAQSETFTIQADQSTYEGYRKSDLMVAKRTGVLPSEGNVNLQFEHQLSKVIIKLTAGTGITQEDLNNCTVLLDDEHIYERCQLTITGLNKNNQSEDFSISLGSVIDTSDEDGGNYNGIKLGQYKAEGNAGIVIPQTVSYEDYFMGVVLNGADEDPNNDVYLWAGASTNITFEPSKVHTITVKVNREKIQMTNVSIKGWETGTDYPDESITGY